MGITQPILSRLSHIRKLSTTVTVTLAYSDTFLLSRGCHCKRGRLYLYVPPPGLQLTSSDVWKLFVAIALHAVPILFCIGMEMTSGSTKKRHMVGHSHFVLTCSCDHGCQMAIAGILDCMCLALRASALWLRYTALQNLPSGNCACDT